MVEILEPDDCDSDMTFLKLMVPRFLSSEVLENDISNTNIGRWSGIWFYTKNVEYYHL
jgi:hypothetical protein